MGALALIIKHLPMIYTLVSTGIRFAELFHGRGKGAEKRTAVVAFVRESILATEGITGKDILDEEEFTEGIGLIVDGTVKIFNSTGKFGRETEEAKE